MGGRARDKTYHIASVVTQSERRATARRVGALTTIRANLVKNSQKGTGYLLPTTTSQAWPWRCRYSRLPKNLRANYVSRQHYYKKLQLKLDTNPFPSASTVGCLSCERLKTAAKRPTGMRGSMSHTDAFRDGEYGVYRPNLQDKPSKRRVSLSYTWHMNRHFTLNNITSN